MGHSTPHHKDAPAYGSEERNTHESESASRPEPSDEALMAQHLKGDPGAFRLLFERYARTIYAVMLKRGLSEDDARDLVQQTFLRAHQARRDYNPAMRFRPWLWTIAFNLLRDGWRRKRAAHNRQTALADQAQAAEQLEPAGNDPAERRAVQRAILTLGAAQQEVVLLHWYQGMTFKEIAQAVGATESAVKVRAHRAYERLRAVLGNGEGEN